MVIRDLLKKADKALSDKGIEDSFNEASVLFAYACGKSKTYIYTHMDDETDESAERLFNRYIKERAAGKPVSYIVGKAWFMSLELSVNESTLIPRPETEGLAEEVLEALKNVKAEKIDLLDICTGSGCIGLAVSYYDRRVGAVLSDINPECVNTAEKNSEKHNLQNRVSVLLSDLYNDIPGKKFNVITANPPYIPSSDIGGLEDDVRLYEPMSALDGGADGLDFYKKIISGARYFLKPGGKLFLEIGIGQSEAVNSILKINGFNKISIKKDFAGIPRIITSEYI